ncbi:MAG: MFS transporter [Methylobacterium frigidaeris]
MLGRAMVRDVSTSHDATRKIATLTMAMTLTPALAPAVGGLISDAFGWRAVFVALAAVVGCLGVLVLLTLPETNRRPVPLPGIGAVAAAYWRLLRVPTYRAYVLAGACAGTSLYAFLAVAPFLLVERLGRSPQEVGLDCLIVVAGMVVGSALAGRLAGRVPIRRAARWGNLVCLVGAASLLAVDRTGHLSVASLLAPLALYAVGVGLLGPNAVAGLMNVDPFAAGAASSLYGFLQMALGALFTLAVAAWSDGSATPVAVTLLAAALVAGLALRRA